MTDPMTPISFEIPTSVAHKISETAPGTLAETALIALRLYHGIGHQTRATLTELADRHNLTPAKTVRLAIEQLEKDTTRLHLNPAAGRPVVNTDRDADIYAKTQTGRTHAAVAAEYGISIVRVGQIVAKQRAMRKDPIKDHPRKLPTTKAAIGLDMGNGMSAETAAAKYGVTVDEALDRYAAYRANLPANPTMLDKINAGRLTEQAAPQETFKVKAPEPTPEAQPTQPAPRKLAVIPPSMKNPELFAEAKPIKFPDPATVDVSMFADDNPDFAI
jgi:transposase